MRKSIPLKILSTMILFGLLGFILIATLGSRMIYNSILHSSSRRLYAEATKIVETRAPQTIKDEEAFRSSLAPMQALAAYENARILYISESGEILLDTASGAADNRHITIEGFDPIALGSTYYTTGRFFNFFDSDQLSVMIPVTYGLQIRGYLAIHVPVSELIVQREQMTHIMLLIFLIAFLVLLLCVIWLTISINRPMRRIVAGVREFAGGNLEYRIDVNADDEMGDLAASLNYMADEMNKSGESQRNFIANVSHDFRSPLTSIKGYVEAIQDGTIPPEMQDRYLGIVLNETKRLEKLTSGILTLNDINDKGMTLDLSRFEINNVIRETCATFEGTCTPRHISVELVLDASELYVSADYGKIQQVLYNLLDNAIKFSRDNSTIRIETGIRHEKVFVSVRDHGIGIPSGQLNKIWDRFYKIDSSRGKDTRGTGLGLAIVKDIIRAHGQNITVVSTEGAGTEFVFYLARG